MPNNGIFAFSKYAHMEGDKWGDSASYTDDGPPDNMTPMTLLVLRKTLEKT